MTASAPVIDDDFTRQADPYRRELLAHCYRMLGSLHDAEDLVQETFVRAWRSYDKFEGKSSLRTWLYRIATRVCLTALEARGKRPLPTDFGGPDHTGELTAREEVPWLEPFPGPTSDGSSDPATIAAERESTRLAFIAALQHLPARQRAVLLLRDVLKWRAAEVAELLGISTAAVNSILQRARATLDKIAPQPDDTVEPSDSQQRETLQQWVAAFESYDMDTLVQLLHAESVWEMPPFLNWTSGARNVIELIENYCPAKQRGELRLVPTTANGQPAFGMYRYDPTDGAYHPFSLQVLTLTKAGVAHTGQFFDVSLYEYFGLPQRLAPSQR